MSSSTSSLPKVAATSDTVLPATAKDPNHDYREVIIAQTKAIKINPDDGLAFYNRGVAYYRSGDQQSAITDYTQVIDFNPVLEIAYYRRGYSYYLVKDYSSAIVDYNRSIKLKPDFALAYASRGYAYRDLYGEQEALIDWRFAAKLFKDQGNLKKYQEIMRSIEMVSGDESCASGML